MAGIGAGCCGKQRIFFSLCIEHKSLIFDVVRLICAWSRKPTDWYFPGTDVLNAKQQGNLCAKQRQSGALPERLRYNYNSWCSWMLAQPVHIWSNHPYVRTISSTQPVTRQLSRALVVILLDWSLNLSFLCVNIATEFSDRVAWIGRVVVFSLIILMPSICGLTAKMGLENLTFSSPADPLCNYSQAKQVLCALVSLRASRI